MLLQHFVNMHLLSFSLLHIRDFVARNTVPMATVKSGDVSLGLLLLLYAHTGYITWMVVTQ